MISVIEAIAIYHNIEKSQYKSLSASPHTQLSYSLLQLLTVTQYLWLWSFNQTQRKIRAYCVASQRIHLLVMSTIIAHANLHTIGYMCLDLSSPDDACQNRKIKRNREKNFDSWIKVNTEK